MKGFVLLLIFFAIVVTGNRIVEGLEQQTAVLRTLAPK